MKNTISVALSPEEFFRRLERQTLKDCYQDIYQNKFRACFYSDRKGDRFHLYYRPAHSKNVFRTYLRGRFVQNQGENRIVYWYGKENVTWIRSVILAANFLYAAYLLRTAAAMIAVVFLTLGVLSLSGAVLHFPSAKQRLRTELESVLLKREEEPPAALPTELETPKSL